MRYLLSGAVIMLSLLAMSCTNNKESEKKIAELESRLAELEGGSGTAATPAALPTKPVEETKPEGPLPSFTFAETEHDFGTITAGDVVEHTFEFENTGDAPLIIQSATATCGCTVPEWPREPIPVGETAKVTAKFNSKGKLNIQNKVITITANTWPKQTKLYIKAMVEKGAEGAADAGPVK